MAITSLLACAIGLQVPIDEPPRLRSVLDNGAVVLVERASGKPSVVIDLWLNARSLPEIPVRNGVRHLLEHFLARGPKADIDQRLESIGGLLTANTYRDAMRFEVTVPRSKLETGLRLLNETLSLGPITSDQIAHEAAIIDQESAVRDPATLVSAAAWDAAYAGQAPDPFGNPDVIAATTPASMVAAHRALVRGEGLALVVVGDVDLDSTTKLIRSIFDGVARGTATKPVREMGKPGVATVPGMSEARAALVEGFRKPSTVAALMAGLALASESTGSFFTYTPSDEPGLMVVGRVSGGGFGGEVDSADPQALYPIGRTLARRWVAGYLSNPIGIAHLRGLLLCQASSNRPESMDDVIGQVTYSEFADAVERFRDVRCVKVVPE